MHSACAAGLLNLREIELGGAMEAAGAEALADALCRRSGSLQSLSLEHELQELQDVDVTAGTVSRTLAPALARLSALKELKFCATRAQRFLGSALAPALAGLTQLEILDLRYGNTGGLAAEAFAHALTQLTNLRHVMLVSCIRHQEAAILVPALARLTKVTEMYLYCSTFGDEGTDAMGDAAMQMPELRKLGLCYCRHAATPMHALHA